MIDKGEEWREFYIIEFNGWKFFKNYRFEKKWLKFIREFEKIYKDKF